jgi:predicted SnoaL-like aldol condensation-catalyzing enzyme
MAHPVSSNNNDRTIKKNNMSTENKATMDWANITHEMKLKSIAMRWLDLISDHKIEEICALTSPEWKMHGGPMGLPVGPEGVHELFRMIGQVKQQWEIEDVITEGDKVAVRATNTCYQDSFFGMPSHGRLQRFSAMFIHRIVDGKIVETWRNADDLGRLLQLGMRIKSGNNGPNLGNSFGTDVSGTWPPTGLKVSGR